MGNVISPKSVAVTGGAGFIGSNSCRWLASNQPVVQIAVFVALTSTGNRANLGGIDEERLTFVYGDICNVELVCGFFGQVYACVHFSAESLNDNSMANPELFVRTNVEGMFVLLEVVRKHDVRFYYISADEVYCDLALDDSICFTEEMPYRPDSPYRSSKASLDLLVCAWVRTFGVRATISNCSIGYAPRKSIEKLIPRQVTNILRGIWRKLFNDGLNTRDWIHADDHSSVMWMILTQPRVNEAYLIGVDGEWSNLDVLRATLKVMGKDANSFDWVRERPGHDSRFAIGSMKLCAEFGWMLEQADFAEGLERPFEWYRENMRCWHDTRDAVDQLRPQWAIAKYGSAYGSR